MIRQIKEVSVFKDMDDRILENIINNIIIKDYQLGEVICLQGKVAEFIYIIISGSVELGLYEQGDYVWSKFYNLEKNDIFGEEAYYEDKNLMSAKCLLPAVLFQMRVKHYRELVNNERSCLELMAQLQNQKTKLLVKVLENKGN